GYVGNPDLDSEIAHTVSATFDWHDARRQKWQLKATPYYTYVDDYIDATQIGTFHPRMAMQETRPILQFANHDAVLYGIDVSGHMAVWDDSSFGRGVLSGVLGYTWSERRDNGESLYHVMPLNAKLTLEQQKERWINAVDVELVARKSRVQDLRLEQESAGYALVNLRTSYTWSHLRIDAGIRNLFDRYHDLPLGGANYAAWKYEGSTGLIGSIPGPGRSYELGATLMF
ncbi:MAG: TonB-dependent receptor, partial [Spongiibacteraceae bacterium]|nr:TonB-dependent receptor [Spongiibacteraceae bacterium]